MGDRQIFPAHTTEIDLISLKFIKNSFAWS